MDFEEFKSLIKERKELLIQASLEYERYNQNGSQETIVEYMKVQTKIKEIEQKILKDSGDVTEGSFYLRLLKIFTVPAEKFEAAVVESLKETNPCYFYKYDSESKNVFEIDGKKHYLHYNKNVRLTCLCESDNNIGPLLLACPELEDVFWNLVKQNVAVINEQQRDTLVQRMIKLQAEINFLNDPKQIEEKIEANYKEKTECKEEWQKLSKGEIVIF